MRIPFLIGRVLAVFLLVTTCLFSARIQAQQQGSFGSGVKGWCTIQDGAAPMVCLGSPEQACFQQWKSFQSWRAPHSRHVAAYPTNSPDLFLCDWTQYGDGRCDGGIGSCHGTGPASVRFYCENGFYPSGFNQCTPDDENTPPRDEACGANSGGNPNLSFGNPVVLFDGAKVERVTDFETADGRFAIVRHYRSNPQIYGVQATNGPIRGAIGGWRFGFELELHLQGTGGNAVTLHLPNGVAYDFTRSGTQFVSTAGSNPQGDYTLEFVGTAPIDWVAIYECDLTRAAAQAARLQC
jgi:hypothetical protein